MDLVHERCAGLDVSKRDAKVCVRIAGEWRKAVTQTVTTWDAVTNQVLALRDHLITEGVTLVVMEATGDYWKPFYYLLEDGPFEVLLVNARHAKNMPGRKTNVSDAMWLAQLGAHGLVRGSFVPPAPIRELRDLTRARSAVVRERGREYQRLEKLLEDAGIKLTSVATDISGISGRAMLEALIAGQRDPAAFADLAKSRLRDKIPALTEALTGRFTEHHAFLARLHLDLIDQHTRAVDQLTARIEGVIQPFRRVRDLIVTIPGISTVVADVIIAETGADMSRFPSAGHLASWAGTCPGSHESAARVKSSRTRPGDPHPEGGARYRRHVRREGQEHVPGGEVSARCLLARTDPGDRRGRACHARRHLEHAHEERLLWRSGRRLLRPAQPRPGQAASPRSAPQTGLQGYDHRGACGGLTGNLPVRVAVLPEHAPGTACDLSRRGLDRASRMDRSRAPTSPAPRTLSSGRCARL
jgi:transposase